MLNMGELEDYIKSEHQELDYIPRSLGKQKIFFEADVVIVWSSNHFTALVKLNNGDYKYMNSLEDKAHIISQFDAEQKINMPQTIITGFKIQK